MENKPINIILDTLQNLTVHWQREIDKVKVLKDRCIDWELLGLQLETIDEQVKDLNKVFLKLDREIIPKAFEEAGLDKISVPELKHSFYPLDKYSASISKEKQVEAFSWLRIHNAAALITETVNRNSLAAFLKDRLIEENLDPPDCMKLEKYVITGSSKYTPKGTK